jgi:PAS domain S-box-containing protein
VTRKDDEDRQLRSVALQNANSILLARQRAEQRSEFYLAEGQRLARIGSWSFNPSGFFDYWSPELFRICGLDPTNGAPTLDEYLASSHPQDRECMARAIEAMLLGGSGCDVKQRIVRPDGELRQLRWVGMPRFDAGVFKGFVGTAMDVTEQEHLTRELRRRETYLAEAQRLSHTGSFGWRISTSEILWSEETFRIFQYDRTTKPTVALVLQRVHPEDVALVSQTIERAAQDGKDFVSEYRLLMPDGSVKHLQVVARAVADESGDIELVGALMDITQRKRAEEAQRVQEREREEMQRQLQQAAKMEAIGRLAGGIAHDFNNILGAILGYGELAQNNLTEGSVVRRQVDQVMHAGARGKGLVERILAFSRSGVGERVPVQVQFVVEETLELLAASLPADVRLERRLDAVDRAVVGDATQFHQVVMNLCTNAVHAMERGGVLTVVLERISVGERRLLSHGTLSAGDYVRLSVSDTGSGIPPAVLERMFDPFFTTKRAGDGTGLGLALVHGIVADFGGVIDVATQVGVGTTFMIWLPAADNMPRLLAESPGELPRGNGETVMIVDDEPTLVALAEETLTELGYDPVGFDSSVAALQAFRAEPKRFDLVLTDETMPDLTGTELARELRQLRPDISIILMSGYSDTQLSERAQAAGVTNVLRKPLIRSDIAEPVARALQTGN